MKRGYLLLAVTALIFGTFETVSKGLTGIPSDQVNFLRFLIGGATMAPFAFAQYRRRNTAFSLRDLTGMAGLGIIFVVVSMGLYQSALSRLSASTTVFAFTANPVFIALFAALVLKEKIDGAVVVFILLSLAGLVFILRPGKDAFSPALLLPVAAAAIFGLFNVYMRRYAAKFGSLTAFTTVVLLGSAANAVVLLIRRIPLFTGIPVGNIPALLYLGVFASGITYVTYYEGMERSSTNTGSIVFFAKPILSTVLAVAVLGETLAPLFLIGAALILTGMTVMIVDRERRFR